MGQPDTETRAILKSRVGGQIDVHFKTDYMVSEHGTQYVLSGMLMEDTKVEGSYCLIYAVRVSDEEREALEQAARQAQLAGANTPPIPQIKMCCMTFPADAVAAIVQHLDAAAAAKLAGEEVPPGMLVM